MVEKWLLQVEKLMLRSVKHVIHQGLMQYAEVIAKCLKDRNYRIVYVILSVS